MNKTNNHPGPPSIIKTNQDDLLKFVAPRGDKGMPINARMVQLEAAKINQAFCDKLQHAKKSIVQRFLRSNAITYCIGTHESQTVHVETKPRFIYNCDQ